MLVCGLSLSFPQSDLSADKSFPIKDLGMINSCLANSPSAYYTELYVPHNLRLRLPSIFRSTCSVKLEIFPFWSESL